MLGGTKSQSAKVLKEFIKKRVTPWVDFTTDLLVLIALYEEDDIGNVEKNNGATNINSYFWTGLALFVTPWLVIFMSLAFSVVCPLMWRAAYIYVLKGKVWKLLRGGTAGKWLSFEERRGVLKNWLDRHLGDDFHGIQIFPKWLPLGPVIPIATFVEWVLCGLIYLCVIIFFALILSGGCVLPIIVWTLSMLLPIAGKFFL